MPTNRPRRRRLLALLHLLPLALALAATAAGATEGAWRITHAIAAPWAASAPTGAALAGTMLALRGGALQGPAPLRCGKATVQATALPAEGLFEGQLAALPDAAAAARALGVAALPAPALRITCPNAGFDLVQADAATWLLALDQRLWLLSGAPGAQAAASSPAGVVQRLLERHFDAGHGGAARGFLPAALADLRPFTTGALQAAAAAWFALPASPDEAPEIDGDPFTDSQEPVLHFAVGTARVRGDRAEVPVRMADEARRWTLHYRLVRGKSGWRVDDVLQRDGTALRRLLQEAGR
ncbi:MAG: hypothetical protein KF683_14410 [Rubrivivax sp.]|nr:hypothetical protein [Rubrivivax sp.]